MFPEFSGSVIVPSLVSLLPLEQPEGETANTCLETHEEHRHDAIT
jgi:hypothetical protein